MIAAVIFVLAFLVLGLSVLFFAFSGRGGARTRRGAPSRAGRRFVAVMVTIVILALGVAVPLAIGVVNGNDHAKNAPGGVDLNAAQTNGRAVFGKYCSTCHTLKASNRRGNGRPKPRRPPPAEGPHPRRDRQGSRARAGPDAGRLGRRPGCPGRGGLRGGRRGPRLAVLPVVLLDAGDGCSAAGGAVWAPPVEVAQER